MSDKKNTAKETHFSSKDLEAILKTPLGAFAFIINSTTEALAEDTDVDEAGQSLMAALTSASEKISKAMDDDSFWAEDDDITQILNICDTLTKEERKAVQFSQDCFLLDLDESMPTAKGKKLRLQKELYDVVLEVFNEINDAFRPFPTEQPFYDALTACLKELADIYSDKDFGESEEDFAWAKEALSYSELISQKLNACNAEKPFDENLFALYESLDEDAQNFFAEDVVDFGTELLADKLSDLQAEYDGLDVDLSAHADRLAAIKQIGRKLQKRYAGAA